jgi:hypothetical protein
MLEKVIAENRLEFESHGAILESQTPEALHELLLNFAHVRLLCMQSATEPGAAVCHAIIQALRRNRDRQLRLQVELGLPKCDILRSSQPERVGTSSTRNKLKFPPAQRTRIGSPLQPAPSIRGAPPDSPLSVMGVTPELSSAV